MQKSFNDIITKSQNTKENKGFLASLRADFKPDKDFTPSQPIEPTETEKEEEMDSETGFLVISVYGEILDIALHLQNIEKQKVVLCITDSEYKKIGEGMIEKTDDWHEYIGKDWTWIIDCCELASLQDWLRDQGEKVVGTNKIMSEYEDNRQKGQELFKEAGFNQPESHNFTDIDEAIAFVEENSDKKWVLKQNGSAPKFLNHIGKFDESVDMLFHLEEMKKGWAESEYGKFDCDLMEVVQGVELACSAFFNGHDFLRDKDGKVVGFLNFEEKKESDGGLGETCGEMGTTFFGCDETNPLFSDIMLRPEIIQVLVDSNYRGVFDINGTMTDEGFTAFEPTSRFGVPASSYEFMEGLKSKTADLLRAMANGEDEPIEIHNGWGMVMVVAGKPFPVEADLDNNATSMGEKIWMLTNGKPSDFTKDHERHIHFENVYCTDDDDYKVATKSGYILTVTGRGKDVEDTRDKLIEYIKNNVYFAGNKYRYDIGERIEEFI